MATKPTDRILDWGSGGTTTDPGAGKEAAGWLVSERPPANWWNWILNSFGKWLTYFETWTDETRQTRVSGRVFSQGASADTPQLQGEFGIDTPQSGDVTSTYIIVRFITPFASSTEYVSMVTSHGVATAIMWVPVAVSTTVIWVYPYRVSDGAAQNPLTTSMGFNLDVKGAV